MLFRAKTGVPWRDLPERFGPWKSVYNRFNNWAKKGQWQAIFIALQLEVDEVGSIFDGSVVRAHQDASAEKGGAKQALDRSRGGFSTKLHAVVDAQRRPIYITISPGQGYEMMKAEELLDHAPDKAFIADTGYHSNRSRQAIRDKKKRAVIGSKPERPRKLPKSRELYGKRSSPSSTVWSGFAPSPRASRRALGTSSRSRKSPARGFGSRTARR